MLGASGFLLRSKLNRKRSGSVARICAGSTKRKELPYKHKTHPTRATEMNNWCPRYFESRMLHGVLAARTSFEKSIRESVCSDKMDQRESLSGDVKCFVWLLDGAVCDSLENECGPSATEPGQHLIGKVQESICHVHAFRNESSGGHRSVRTSETGAHQTEREVATDPAAPRFVIREQVRGRTSCFH